MTNIDERQPGIFIMGLEISDLESMIDGLEAGEQHQSNCLFQLSLMAARLSLSPVSEGYKDLASQTLLELIREKPKRASVIKHSRFTS